jgi:hypothetical protein
MQSMAKRDSKFGQSESDLKKTLALKISEITKNANRAQQQQMDESKLKIFA